MRLSGLYQIPVELLVLVEVLDLLNHLLDLEPEQSQEGELEEGDDAEADDEEGVGAAAQPTSDGFLAAHVVVPVGTEAVGVAAPRREKFQYCLDFLVQF